MRRYYISIWIKKESILSVTTENFSEKESEKRGEIEKLKIKRINEWEVSLLPFYLIIFTNNSLSLFQNEFHEEY